MPSTAKSPARALGKFVFLALALVAFGVFIWSSDRITFQGERTIFTVKCEGGDWQGRHCTGRLATSDRYTFRASRSRQEVLYWIYGSSTPSGRYIGCKVESRSNWSCPVKEGETKTITREIANDHPVHATDGSALPFHAVPKWKWWAIRYGLGRYSDAGL